MRQLNYIPNELARNLYRNRTNTIGVIMPTIAHPFFSTLTAHLQREFAARDLKPCSAPPPIQTRARASTSTCSSGT